MKALSQTFVYTECKLLSITSVPFYFDTTLNLFGYTGVLLLCIQADSSPLYVVLAAFYLELYCEIIIFFFFSNNSVKNVNNRMTKTTLSITKNFIKNSFLRANKHRKKVTTKKNAFTPASIFPICIHAHVDIFNFRKKPYSQKLFDAHVARVKNARPCRIY